MPDTEDSTTLKRWICGDCEHDFRATEGGCPVCHSGHTVDISKYINSATKQLRQRKTWDAKSWAQYKKRGLYMSEMACKLHDWSEVLLGAMTPEQKKAVFTGELPGIYPSDLKRFIRLLRQGNQMHVLVVQDGGEVPEVYLGRSKEEVCRKLAKTCGGDGAGENAIVTELMEGDQPSSPELPKAIMKHYVQTVFEHNKLEKL